MKHYYDDLGILSYEINRDLLVELAKLLPRVHGPETVIQRGEIHNLAIGVEYDYACHKGCGGIGGCITLEQWRALEEETPVQTVLKKMLFDFVDQGYVVNEFLLVAHSAICEIQIHSICSPDD